MKKIFIALKEIKGNEEFLMKLHNEYLVKSTTYLSSLNHWLKEGTCDLIVIEPGIESNGFFMDPRLLNRCGAEFYKQRIKPREIPTIFLVGHEECKKTIEGLFPNSNFGEKNNTLLHSIKELIG